MRVIVQRVAKAKCTIEQEITGSIHQGLCLFVGFEVEDDLEILEKMAAKILRLRIFSDEAGKMNRSVLDIEGEILSISQFTLYADLKGQNRPGFTRSMEPGQAEKLYERFNEILAREVPVQTGIFGADMKISLVNDGPVTIILDSDQLFKKIDRNRDRN